jgi:anti-sigma regulatory factor (Ser/Thr protein kinase)
MKRAATRPRRHRLDLLPTTAAAGAGRRFVRERLVGLMASDELDTVELLTSEVVTNAVVHAGTTSELQLVVWDDRVRVEVVDGGGGMPAKRTDLPLTADSGRGLQIVDSLASDWGVEMGTQGKRVWFEVARAG